MKAMFQEVKNVNNEYEYEYEYISCHNTYIVYRCVIKYKLHLRPTEEATLRSKKNTYSREPPLLLSSMLRIIPLDLEYFLHFRVSYFEEK